MAQDNAATTTNLKVRPFNPDTVFLMVNDPFRRSVIGALANGGMKTVAELRGPSGTKHNQMKHIAALCKARILVRKENTREVRKPFFGLGPGVIVRREENVLIVDLGYCRLRFP